MINALAQNYLQYSKRIAIFGIAQWAAIALLTFLLVAVSVVLDRELYSGASDILDNVVACSSTLAVAISTGYYAHSAYDNTLKSKTEESTADGNG